jgi:hypothetical protein
MNAKEIKKITSGTFAVQSMTRRVLSVVLIILGAFVTLKGLNPQTTWEGLLVLLTPWSVIGLGIQIVGGILSSGERPK